MDGTWLTLASVAALALGARRRGSRYRREDEMLTVKSRSGKVYNLRVVPPGGKYGANHGLTNDGVAMLEFYWPNDRIGVQPWGQFTGERYHLTTLIKNTKTGALKGLALQDGREQFSPDTMNRAVVWALGGNPDSSWG